MWCEANGNDARTKLIFTTDQCKKKMNAKPHSRRKKDTICQLALLSVQVIGRERETFADIYQLVSSLSRHEVPQ